MLGAPVISVFILKQLLGHCCTPACIETAATPAVDEPPPPDTQRQAEPRLQLSDREAAILNSLVQGAPNKVIAYQLKITEATVKVHVKAILRKIQVKNRTQAAIWALNRQVFAETLGAGNGGLPPPKPVLAGLRNVRRLRKSSCWPHGSLRGLQAIEPALFVWLRDQRAIRCNVHRRITSNIHRHSPARTSPIGWGLTLVAWRLDRLCEADASMR